MTASKVGLTAATLVAMKVPKNKVDDVACAINEYGNISHNYEREHEYNVWFTITASKQQRINHYTGRNKAKNRN